jgi:hypothetical protein
MGDQHKQEKPSLLSNITGRIREAAARLKDDGSAPDPPPSYPVFNAHDRTKSGSSLMGGSVSGSRLSPAPQRSEAGASATAASMGAASAGPAVKTTEDGYEEILTEEETSLSQQERSSLLSRFIKEMTEPRVDAEEEEDDIAELNVKQLRDNIKRFNLNLAITKQVHAHASRTSGGRWGCALYDGGVCVVEEVSRKQVWVVVLLL